MKKSQIRLLSTVYEKTNVIEIIHFFNQTLKKRHKKTQYLNWVFKAESEGFEPPVRCRTMVFKTIAFDHSANSPRQR